MIGNTLYGTTGSRADGPLGTIFRINLDGTGFTTMHVFSYADGAFPVGGLTLSGNTLYGTTAEEESTGTIYKINVDGTGFDTLYTFMDGSDGANPSGSLTVSGQYIYGTTDGDLMQTYGSIYKVGINGQNFTSLYTYTQLTSSGGQSGLVLSGTTLYGTNQHGGTNNNGTLYKLQTDGSGFSVIASFGAAGGGYDVNASLTLINGVLYGTTRGGGLEYGTVFKINLDGTGLSTLYEFNGDGLVMSGIVSNGTTLYGAEQNHLYRVNTDGTNSGMVYRFGDQNGEHPQGGLIQSGNTFYGTTYQGGPYGDGTVYKVSSDGSGFATLHAFDGTDGANPQDGLVLVGNTLYGTTSADTIFEVNTDGRGFASLYSSPEEAGSPQYMRSGLTASGTVLYGGSLGGGTNLGGTVFKINTDGTGFSIIYNLPAGDNGSGPNGPLVVAGNSLYGVTSGGGVMNSGRIFMIHTDGTGFAILHTFNRSGMAPSPDGSNPSGGLVMQGSQLYGTTEFGGVLNGEGTDGTVFKINTDGTGFQTLAAFSGIGIGYPNGGLLLNGSTLYGTTSDGGLGEVYQVDTDGTGFRKLYGFVPTEYDGQRIQDTPNYGLVLDGNVLYGAADSGTESAPSNGIVGQVFAINLGEIPSLTATSIAADAAGETRVLYDGSDGSASEWTFDATGAAITEGSTYGPYTDFQGAWQAQALAVASDSSARVLWTRSDRAAGVWSLDQSGYETQIGPVYGPYAGWTAKAISVAGNGTSRVLWTNTSGAAGVWSFDTNDAVTVIGPTYGPYYASGAEWSAASLAAAPGGASRLLWSRADGAAGIWTLDASDKQSLIGPVYGPVADSVGAWSAVGIGISGDNTARLLWRRADGAAGLWTMTATDTFASAGAVYGPFVDAQGVWSASALGVSGDGTSRVLWTRTDGAAGVWSFGANDLENLIGPVYGPY